MTDTNRSNKRTTAILVAVMTTSESVLMLEADVYVIALGEYSVLVVESKPMTKCD